MSLARAFTTRRAKPTFELQQSNVPQRSNTTSKRHGFDGSIRHMISAPTELTHTTNMLAYTAPDLYPKSESSPTSSRTSDDDSDGNRTAASSPPTSPDIASSGDRSASPEPNHLSCYFTTPGQKPPTTEAPRIPQRAPSHTKRASFENLARQQSLRQSNHSGRSASSKGSYSLSRSSSTSTAATSVTSLSFARNKEQIPEVPEVPAMPVESLSSPTPLARQLSQKRSEAPVAHPFGKELAQVSEIAEEFGVKDRLNVYDAEAQDLVQKGLCRFRAEDYLCEVQGLFATYFAPEKVALQPIWI